MERCHSVISLAFGSFWGMFSQANGALVSSLGGLVVYDTGLTLLVLETIENQK